MQPATCGRLDPARALELVPDPEQPTGDIGTALELEVDALEHAALVLPEGAVRAWALLLCTGGEVECAKSASVHGQIVHPDRLRVIRETPDVRAASAQENPSEE